MKRLLYKWRKYLLKEDASPSMDKQPQQGGSKILPRQVVEDLIYEYSITDGLKWKRIDFTSNQYFKNNAENPAAVYFTQDDPSFEFYHTMMINNVPNIDIIMQISYILHEIQHFNQHMTWNKGIEQRKKYISGKKLPEDFDIKNYTFTDLILFWEKEYGYKNSPHEVDANNFAIKNLKKALESYSKPSEIRNAIQMNKKFNKDN